MAKRIQKQRISTNIYEKYQKLLNQYKKLISTYKRLISTNKILNYDNNYKYCPKNIYINYDGIQDSKRLKKLNRKTNFDVNKLKNILKKLKVQKIKQKNKPNKHVNNIITNKIGTKINESKLFEGVNKSIDNINQTWPNYKIKLLKEELKKIDYSDFNFDNPLSNLKIDTFLDLLLIPSNNFNQYNNNIKILGIQNCTTVPLIKGIKFIDPQSQKEILFNKDFIKSKISTNIGIVNAFYKMLQKFTDKKHLELNVLINEINKMIDNTCIYFSDMPINTCGLTISNGDIYISGDYLQEAMGETEEYKILKIRNSKINYKFKSICKIYLTLLHEFSNKLHYLMRVKENHEWKNNFFDHSEEINLNNNLEYYINLSGKYSFQNKQNYNNLHNYIDKSGDFFDRELYVGTRFLGVDENISEFFLCEKCSIYSNYINKLKNLRKIFSQKSKCSSISKFKIVDNSSRCNFSIIRHS